MENDRNDSTGGLAPTVFVECDIKQEIKNSPQTETVFVDVESGGDAADKDGFPMDCDFKPVGGNVWKAEETSLEFDDSDETFEPEIHAAEYRYGRLTKSRNPFEANTCLPSSTGMTVDAPELKAESRYSPGQPREAAQSKSVLQLSQDLERAAHALLARLREDPLAQSSQKHECFGISQSSVDATAAAAATTSAARAAATAATVAAHAARALLQPSQTVAASNNGTFASRQKVQICRGADGRIQVRGLLPGQQLVQRPDGQLMINTNNYTAKVAKRSRHQDAITNRQGDELIVATAPLPPQLLTSTTAWPLHRLASASNVNNSLTMWQPKGQMAKRADPNIKDVHQQLQHKPPLRKQYPRHKPPPEQEQQGGEEMEAPEGPPVPRPLTVTAELTATAQGPRIILQGLQGLNLSQEQLVRIQNIVKSELLNQKARAKQQNRPPPIKVCLQLPADIQPHSDAVSTALPTHKKFSPRPIQSGRRPMGLLESDVQQNQLVFEKDKTKKLTPSPCVNVLYKEQLSLLSCEGGIGAETFDINEKPFECVACRKSFRTVQELNVHVRVHSGAKPYACHLCHKSFSQQGSLRIHVRIHTGEKPYSCSMCHRAFSTKGAMRDHERKHAMGTLLFFCPVCAEMFARAGNLRAHMRCHGDENILSADTAQNIISAAARQNTNIS